MMSPRFLPRFARAGAGLRDPALRACAQVVAGLAVAGPVLAANGTPVLLVLLSGGIAAVAVLLPIQVAGNRIRGGMVVLAALFLGRARMSFPGTVDIVRPGVTDGAAVLMVPPDGPRGALTAALAATICSLVTVRLLLCKTTVAEAG